MRQTNGGFSSRAEKGILKAKKKGWMMNNDCEASSKLLQCSCRMKLENEWMDHFLLNATVQSFCHYCHIIDLFLLSLRVSMRRNAVIKISTM